MREIKRFNNNNFCMLRKNSYSMSFLLNIFSRKFNLRIINNLNMCFPSIMVFLTILKSQYFSIFIIPHFSHIIFWFFIEFKIHFSDFTYIILFHDSFSFFFSQNLHIYLFTWIKTKNTLYIRPIYFCSYNIFSWCQWNKWLIRNWNTPISFVFMNNITLS
jgi:hypothetical protein